MGELLSVRHPRPRAFIATKVWISGREAGIRQMADSFRLLQTHPIDLMQIHNLPAGLANPSADVAGHESGGAASAISASPTIPPRPMTRLRRCSRRRRWIFCRSTMPWTIARPNSGCCPLARDKGVAVICNTPFGGGGLLRPSWADAVARLGGGSGRPIMGAIGAEVRTGQSGHHLRDTGHGQPEEYGGKRGGGHRAGIDPAAGAGTARVGLMPAPFQRLSRSAPRGPLVNVHCPAPAPDMAPERGIPRHAGMMLP